MFVFVCMVLCGAATGVVFDLFRALRRCIKAGSGVIAAQDLMLWLAELMIVYYTSFKVNNAHIRGYEIIALIIGAVLYFVTVSDWLMKVMCRVIMLLIRAFTMAVGPFKRLSVCIAARTGRLFEFAVNKLKLFKNAVHGAFGGTIFRLKAVMSEKKRKI